MLSKEELLFILEKYNAKFIPGDGDSVVGTESNYKEVGIDELLKNNPSCTSHFIRNNCYYILHEETLNSLNYKITVETNSPLKQAKANFIQSPKINTLPEKLEFEESCKYNSDYEEAKDLNIVGINAA